MEGDHRSAPVGALPRAHGGKGWCMRRALPFACPSLMALCFYGGPGFLHEHFWLWGSLLLSPQAVCSLSTAVPFPGLLSKPHIPAPSPSHHPPVPPSLHWWTPILGWGTQGCGRDHLRRPHSVLLHSPLHSLLHFPHTQISPSVPSNIPACEGASPDAGTSSHRELPAAGTGPIQGASPDAGTSSHRELPAEGTGPIQGASPDAGTSSHRELPAEGTGPIQLPLFFLLFYVLCGDLVL